jgi:hypothetical protein
MLVDKKFVVQATDTTPNLAVSDPRYPFPAEYSVLGWFKWIPLDSQKDFHLAFRATVNDASTLKND